MSTPVTKQVRIEFRTDPMPDPIFANHMHLVEMGGFVTITFYTAVLATAPLTPQQLPDTLEARAVAQVVIPSEQWEQLLNNIGQKSVQPRPIVAKKR